MGYCYGRSSSGRYALCCDHCGKVGARKRPCPYRYCPAVALCKECNAGEPGREYKRYHVENHCKEKHIAFTARWAETDRRIATGEFLRGAACSEEDCPKGWVKVWFKGACSDRIRFMPSETYDAIPMLTDATEADYAAFGLVLEVAPAA